MVLAAVTYLQRYCLTLNFLVAVMNTFNTKTHSSTEIAGFSSENADVGSICYCE